MRRGRIKKKKERIFSKDPSEGRLHLSIRGEQSVLKRVFTICYLEITQLQGTRNYCTRYTGRDRPAIFLLSLSREDPLFTDTISNVSPALKSCNKSFEFVFLYLSWIACSRHDFIAVTIIRTARLKCKSIHLYIGHTRVFCMHIELKICTTFLYTSCS